MELQAEKEVPELIQRRRLDRALRPAGFDDVVDSRLSSTLLERVDDGIKVITKVATKSKNLKGTFVKALKEAAEMIREAVNALQSISSTDETRRLQADNKRLRDEVATLQKEALEERLLPEKRLRPPLAADRRSAEPGPSSAPDPTPTSLGETWSAVVRKGKGKGKKTVPALDVQMSASISAKPKKSVAKPVATPKPPAAAVKSITVPRPPLVATGSAAVPKSGTASRPAVATATPAAANKKKRRRRGRKLRAPTTAAVVITLQHDAVEKGVTYSDVLTKARQRLDLTALNIPAGLKVRQAAPGARVLELPAGVTSEAADSFAAKLREVLAGEARIARPVKCADLRLTGLDDSVTRDEVLAAIVAAAACPLDHVKAGEIREGRRGTGCIWVQCPVAAAKVLVSARSMRIGWSYVHVESLEPRPMKCFRCLEIGHTRLQCTSEVNRSDICYRCSAPGHKAAACLAKPHKLQVGQLSTRWGLRVAPHRKKGKKPAGPRPPSRWIGIRPDKRKCVSTLIMDRDRHFLQINLNHCAGAQDLLFQALAQWQIGLAVVAEPYCIPANWIGDATGTAAIYVPDGTTPLSVKERGNGFVAADWGKYTIFSVYFSPNKTLAELETLLGDTQAAIRRVAPRPLAILRAKDTAWGELLAGLDRDPWGRPYRATRGKLGRGPPPAESISPERLATVLEALFPAPTGVYPTGA
ncbi:unnamed protein product, partial [Iphiclides podalirius]